MPVGVQWVDYGRPAADALRRVIAEAKGNDPLAPVSVVVPSNHVGVGTRRLLASGDLGPVCGTGTGIAAVTFLTVYRLAELLGSPRLAEAGHRPVSTPVIAAALRAALRERPGVFAPVASHPATEMALVAAYRELRDVSAAGCDALGRTSTRAADVVHLQREARRRLERDWYDEEDLMDAAVEVLRADGAVARGLGPVVVHLPERLTRHGAALLRAVAEERQVTVLAGSSGDLRADAEVSLAVRRLAGPDGAGGDAGNGAAAEPPDSDPMRVVAEGRTRIVTVSDADEEVREAVRAIVDAARAGTPLDRMAVLHASPEPYARLAHEQLTAAGVATNGASVTPLQARVASRTLLGLLGLPEGDFRREDVFSWLSGARVRHEGRPVPVTAWERISRDAGVVAGRAQWDRLLERFADDREASAAAADADPDSPPWRAERWRGEAARARELRRFVLDLVHDLASAAAGHEPWSVRARWARGHLERLLGGPAARRRWPPAEEKAAERLERALDRLGGLDAVEGPTDLETFTRTLELELEADLGRVGRMGEGVLVAPVSMGVGLDLDLVVVLGLAEGSFPAPGREDSLLPDHERRAAGDELSLRAGQVERQHRQLLAALAGASHQLLCAPRGDLRRSLERVPSRWVLDVASALEGTRWWSEDLLAAERPWLLHLASFDAGMRRVAFPAGEQEYRLRALMAHTPAGDGAGALAVLGDAVAAAGAEAVAARRSRRFTRFDGNLAGLAVPSPAEPGRVTSATRLEGWAACPFAYLLHDVLGVDEVENPEEELEITPLSRGSLVHEVLERFIDEILARSADEQPPPDRPWSASDRARLRAIADEVCAGYEARGLTGRPLFWRRDRPRIVEDLLEVLDRDDRRRASRRARPLAAELAFGMPGADLPTVTLRLGDGRTVAFRGKADRVDLGEDGTVYVVDYKTGKADRYRRLSENDPDLGGTRLQLPVYGQAARLRVGDLDAPVRAEYWFVTTKGKFETVGYDVTPEVLERVGHTLQAVVTGIEAGVFPSFPTTQSTSPFVECPYCDPDSLGVVDLRRAWERKRDDPALAGFAALAEADVEEEGGDGG